MTDIVKETEIQWVKHGNAMSVSLLAKDIVVLSSGNFITFLETGRPEKREFIYHANNETKGDGVQCLCTHRALPCFAFAEMCRNPRILIISYPTFEIFKSFDSVTDTNYLTMRFSEMEYLVALTGIPDFKIVIWNWKTSEKLYSQETKFTSPNQSLGISPIVPFQIIQTTSSDRKILLWDVNICYKKTLLNKAEATLPLSSQPPYCFMYGADGEIYFVDSEGSLYSINPETHVCALQILSKGETTGHCVPCLAWYKGGLAFSVPGEIQLWRRKSPEGWTKIWGLKNKMPIKFLLSSLLKDLLIGVNSWNEIIFFKGDVMIETVTLRSYGSDFEFLCFLYPVGDCFITFGNEKKIITLWNKLNGQKISQHFWFKAKINALESSPKWPFVVAATASGGVHALNAFDTHFILECDEIFLTKNSLNAIRFRDQGSVFCVASMDVGEFFLLRFQSPGKIEVLAQVQVDLKIVDFAVSEKDQETKLLIVPMSQFCCRSGQAILMYALDEKQKTFEFAKDVNLPSVITSISQASQLRKEVFCIPHRSRRFFVMNIGNGKMLSEHVSGHQMKSFILHNEDAYFLTYGVDGILIVKSMDAKKCATVFATHHRLAGGIQRVIVDPYMQCAVVLGWDGSLVCANFKKLTNLISKPDNEALLYSPACKLLFFGLPQSEKLKARGDRASVALSEAIVFKDKKKLWMDIREQELIAVEEQQNKKEKTSILEELFSIRKRLGQLLDENEANVPERQLPVQAFDLDKVARRKKIEDAKTEREKEKQLRLACMKHLNKITDLIKKHCWDGVQIKGRQLHAILAPVAIQSYALLFENAPQAKLTWLIERLKIEQFFRKGDYFEAWVPRTDSSLELHINNKFQVSSLDVTQTIKTKFEEEQLDDEKTKTETEDQKQRFVWTGTSTHNFVEVDPYHYSQFELTTFLQSHQEIKLIEIDIKKLMLWFNQEFEETFALKEREMAFVYERNARLRHIIKELSFFNFSQSLCKTQIYDPVWAPEENPDTIMRVEDYEVKVPIYISESQYELIKKKETEEQRIKQLLLASDFRERALMTMMDGVLEKLWEDSLKKDVPKPKCMQKETEKFTEEDLKAVKAYEEAVRFLASERERYRKILEAEWTKTIATTNDSVSKFDEKVQKLHVLKLKVESAIGQEILKCLRIRQRCFQRTQMDQKENTLTGSLMKNEKKIESLTLELNKLMDLLNDCKNYYETLQNKDRHLDKNFKKEFPEYSLIICEQLYKLSKKRPKLMQKTNTYSAVLNDMGKCAVSGSKPEFMPLECIQYLRDIDALDAYVNCPAAVTQQSWEMVCKMRRIKIECELKIRACAVELADAENTVSNYQKALKAAKEYQIQLQSDLQAVRSEKLNSALNYQIQLVLKKGQVEIPLTGHIKDFEESVLATKDILNEVNEAINKMGRQKIKAMQRAANFRRGIIYKEWEHKKLRMEIEDLKEKLESVEKLQVLKELQAILVARARGFSDEKGFLYLENEIFKTKKRFEKTENEMIRKIEDIKVKTENLTAQNRKLDEKIVEVNVEVNEINLERDMDFDEKNAEESARRMRKVREKSRLARKIKEQHKEILLLKTELELLRLKSYPTMKYQRA